MPTDGAYTMITAHAGAESTRPNTLESLRTLAGLGVDAVEVDVRDVDGALVLSHNPPAPGERCAALEDALRLIRDADPRVKVNIDLKQMDLTEAVWAAAERCGMTGRLLFTGSVCPADERFMRGRPAEIWYNEFLLQPEERADPLASVLRRGHPAINLHYSLVDPAALSPGDARHYSCWTVDREDAIAALLRAGVLNITTRIPCRALALRAEIQGRPEHGRRDG